MKDKPPGVGGSSFKLVDSEKVLGQLGLKQGDTFLDMACGKGEYAIEISKIIGDEGLVYAVDLWEENIVELKKELSAAGIKNMEAIVADVSKPMPIDNDSVDVCLMATVLHDLISVKTADGALKEAARVLKQHGLLTVLEFKKIDGPPGPPIHIRLSSKDIESFVTPFGFLKRAIEEVGDYNYLITFDLLS